MVGIYCRISGDKEEGKDTSIEYQEERGIGFANEMGMLYEVYKDINVSGKADIIARDEFHRFIGDVKSGKITHVFAIHQDRIERNPDTWRYFVSTVLNAGVQWFPDGKFYDLDSTTNRAMANLLSIFNEMHSDKTSDAVKVAFYRNALKGKVHGIRPYGITKDEDGYMIHEPNEIKVVKDIFKWSLEGLGVYSIAKKLNDLNIPTRFATLDKSTTTIDSSTGRKVKQKNKVWWGSTVHGILKKKLYAGFHVWNKEEIELPHLALVTLDEFDKVQENLKKNKRTKSGKKPIYKYLLNGLIYCHDCSKMYKGKRRLSDRRNQYICSGKQAPLHICKTSKGFNIPRFETFIIKHLFLSKDLQKHLNNIEVDTVEIDTLTFKKNELKSKIKTAEKQETKAFNLLFGDDDLSDDTRLKAKYKETKNKVVSYKESLEQVESELKIQTDNNRLNRVNRTIEGFNLNAGFEAIKLAVQQLIERVDVEYRPLKKNGRFIFRIKYKGFQEHISYAATQQLDRFACVNYENTLESYEYAEGLNVWKGYKSSNKHFLKSDANFNEYFDKFYKHHSMPIRVNKEELLHFD
ncbi:recombinase family protein [Psychroserpens ponticola]|uniref:Recombinase family protein n=1 Tax=Psychroserpens ponticola TaxID=2932268 RepID=A0ABY7S0C5_9FLAO|nr:recombinase family protein [Psychroserpens ponticola]WCO02748.1 recombinase family protein [Psychroserpens ponticola]